MLQDNFEPFRTVNKIDAAAVHIKPMHFSPLEGKLQTITAQYKDAFASALSRSACRRPQCRQRNPQRGSFIRKDFLSSLLKHHELLVSVLFCLSTRAQSRWICKQHILQVSLLHQHIHSPHGRRPSDEKHD